MRLEDKVAVVTGSGRGIGAAIAHSFAKEGAKVVLISRTLEQLEKQKESILQYGSECLSIAGDVSKEADVQRMGREIKERFGTVDILVNAAGITTVSPSEALARENWGQCLDVNLTGTFLVCREIGREMIRAKRGKIINITSVDSHAGIPQRAAYAASKGGVKQLNLEYMTLMYSRIPMSSILRRSQMQIQMSFSLLIRALHRKTLIS